ncbi:piRNA biogenesis protein EXD1-like [Gigantopelta aegis]|uniref:piRNA biogenesis protein EXD1-like n=1 Tax=Gigantopelta aegis TaxID=1735272 RepID=UPI001B88A962|nr:piRNA biogenesis protein EXD1-like [Gigantopelta aegis]
MTSSYTIVDRVDRARTAVQELMKEDYVSVDAEGVNMSKTGPLTLLQVGKKDGHVFLFDVLTCPQIFKDGGLQGLLEGVQVLKVMHSSSNDSTSLKCQFDILLQNVF